MVAYGYMGSYHVWMGRCIFLLYRASLRKLDPPVTDNRTYVQKFQPVNFCFVEVQFWYKIHIRNFPPLRSAATRLIFFKEMGVAWYLIWKVFCSSSTSVIFFKIGLFIIEKFTVERFISDKNCNLSFVSFIGKN